MLFYKTKANEIADMTVKYGTIVHNIVQQQATDNDRIPTIEETNIFSADDFQRLNVQFERAAVQGNYIQIKLHLESLGVCNQTAELLKISNSTCEQKELTVHFPK